MKPKFFFVICIALLSAASPGFTEEASPSHPKTGLSAQIFIGAGWAVGKGSGLDTDPARTRLNDWKQGNKNMASAIPMAEASLHYHFSTATTLRVESGAESIGAPAFGLSQTIPATGTLGVLVSMGSSDVWKDPYLLGQDRAKTKENKKSLSFFFEDILETGLNLHYTSVWSHVKEDESGLRSQDLRRRGQAHHIRLDCGLPLSEKLILAPGLRYELGNFSGKSNAYQAFGGDLALTRIMEGWMMTLSLGGTARNFEKRHPVFAKTREEREGSAALTLAFPAPLGYDDLTLMVMMGHNTVQANHTFFENRTSFAGAGVRYAF